IAVDGRLFETFRLPDAEFGHLAETDVAADAFRFDARVRARLADYEAQMAAFLARPRAQSLAAHRTPHLPPLVVSPREALRRVRAARPMTDHWRSAIDNLVGQPLVEIKPLCL